MRMRPAVLAAAGLTVPLLVSGCAGGAEVEGAGKMAVVRQPPNGPWQGSLVGTGYPLPEQTHTDTSGAYLDRFDEDFVGLRAQEAYEVEHATYTRRS